MRRLNRGLTAASLLFAVALTAGFGLLALKGVEPIMELVSKYVKIWKKMNVEHRTSNIEHRIGKFEETEELIKIFVTSIKTAVRQAHGPERSRRAENKQK